MHINLQLFVVICDAPATGKTFNIHQFNGQYGCFHCLNPGELSGQYSRIYKYIPNTELRTNHIYLNKVDKAFRTNKMYYGIKGKCVLSNYIPCPERALIDYMHCCILETIRILSEVDNRNSLK